MAGRIGLSPVAIALTIAALTAAHAAEAAQIAQVRSYNEVLGNVAQPLDLAFDRFDAQLGVLTNVSYAFEFTLASASIDYENRSGVARAAQVEIETNDGRKLAQIALGSGSVLAGVAGCADERDGARLEKRLEKLSACGGYPRH